MIIKIPKIPRSSKPGAVPSIPKAYRPWLMLLLALLVVSLFVLVVTASVAFIYYVNVLTPLWLIVLGALAAFGVAVGFGGLFLLLVVAGYSSFKTDPPQSGTPGLAPDETTSQPGEL